MTDEQIIAALGGASKVAELCECSPQAVSQWFGSDPTTNKPRSIPNARLLFLKAIRPDVFASALPTQDACPAVDTALPAGQGGTHG